MSPTRSRIKSFVAVSAVATVAAGLLTAASPRPDVAQAQAGQAHVLTVIANVEEAYNTDTNRNDLDSRTDVKNWVLKLLDETPGNPDVLLLQEVTGNSAEYVASVLRNRTGNANFRVVKKAWTPAARDYDTKQIIRDTAIILNLTTMQVADGGRYYTGTYPGDVAVCCGLPLKFKQAAVMLAKHRATGVTSALSSVHLTRKKDFRTLDASEHYRAKWSRQIYEMIMRRYPGRDATTIGGDFNQDRCVTGEFKSCEDARFYDRDTESFRFHDIVWEMPADTGSGMLKASGVDYIFSSGTSDRGGIFETPDVDHKTRWAILDLP